MSSFSKIRRILAVSILADKVFCQKTKFSGQSLAPLFESNYPILRTLITQSL